LEVGSGVENAVLEVGNRKELVFLLVITRSKMDYGENVTYRDRAQKAIESMKEKLDDPKTLRGPVELVINGRSAIQYEFSGTLRSEQLRVHYIHTTVDGAADFHQLMAWSTPSRIEQHRSNIQDVTRSFAEVR